MLRKIRQGLGLGRPLCTWYLAPRFKKEGLTDYYVLRQEFIPYSQAVRQAVSQSVRLSTVREEGKQVGR